MEKQSKFIQEIEQAYEKIADKWFVFHKRIAFYFVLSAFFIELIVTFALNWTTIIHNFFSTYLLKRLLIPSGINVGFLVIISIVSIQYPGHRLLKKYTVSLCFSAISFVLFAAYNIFPALYFLCILPVLLTAVYGDYKLTTVTFLCTIIGIIILEGTLCLEAERQCSFSSPLLLTNFLISLFVLAGFYVICLILIFFEHQKNAASIKKEMERLELQQALLRDGMTKLFNRSALQEELNNLSFCECTYTFVMIDLDNFKILNDTCGHLKGDHCIKAFAAILKKCTFPHPAFRFGGDEFCVLFKEAPLDYVIATCEYIKNQLISYTNSNNCTFLSASFGIAESKPNMSIKTLLHNADTALYQAKNQKNCISMFS